MSEKIAVTTAEVRESKMSKEQIVRFQIVVYCHLHNVRLSPSDIDCLTMIGLTGKSDLSKVCRKLVEKDIFSSDQSVRNSLTKLQDKGLLKKEGSKLKLVYLAEDMKIQNTGNILLDIKCFSKNES